MPAMRLIFRPDGVQPQREDFTCLEFHTWEQIVSYLTVLRRPLERQPWVWDGYKIIDPASVLERASH